MSTAPPSPAAPSGAPKFDGYAGEYDALHAESIAASGESTEYFARYKLDCLVRLGIDVGAPVLDYGCGIGNLTTLLAGAFGDVHGFDPSSKSVAMARERTPSGTFYDAKEDLPEGKFAAIVLACVLHHVPPAERPALIAELRGKLAPGGKLVVFEHNPLNPLTLRAVKACAFDDDAILLWPWEARSLVEAGGLGEVTLDYIVFFPRALAPLRPLEPKLRWLPIGAQTMVVGRK